MRYTRPYYETPEDLSSENAFKEYIESLSKTKLEKLPIKYSVDFISFKDGNPSSMVETKIRKVSIDKYPSYMISLAKVTNALSLCKLLGIPFVLFVKWTDAAGYVTISEADIPNLKVGMQSVNFRNDANDIEPCVFIPINFFKLTYDKRR